MCQYCSGIQIQKAREPGEPDIQKLAGLGIQISRSVENSQASAHMEKLNQLGISVSSPSVQERLSGLGVSVSGGARPNLPPGVSMTRKFTPPPTLA